MLKFFSFVCIFLSIFFFALSGFWIFQRFNPSALSFSETPVRQSFDGKVTSRAISLSIPSAGIAHLPIFGGKIENNKWPMRSDGLVRLTTSPEPGEIGNSIIYGHNWKNIFGNLLNVKPGQIVEIQYLDGKSKKFEVSFTQTVSPEQTQILNNTSDERITLYTCTGFLDSKRFVVVANLLK